MRDYAYSNRLFFKGVSLRDGLRFKAFPNAGIYVFKSSAFYLAITAGPNGQDGNGGHAHNDKLGFELSINGKDLVKDPGAYLYTPFYERRNEFRSTAHHPVPYVKDLEQNRWRKGRFGCFSMLEDARVKVNGFLDSDGDIIDLSDNTEILSKNENFNVDLNTVREKVFGLSLSLSYQDVQQKRVFYVLDDGVEISDQSSHPFSVNLDLPYSNGYGQFLKET